MTQKPATTVLAALPLGMVLIFTPVAHGYFAGGGKDVAKGNDCLIGYNGIDPADVTLDGKAQVVHCTDCDPTCDHDGETAANGSCTLKVGVCINQGGVEGCVPPSALDEAAAKGKVNGVKVPAGRLLIPAEPLEGPVCWALLDVLIPVRETKKGAKDGKASVNLSASVKKHRSEGVAGRSDKDMLTYLCQPRPEDEACPIPTTTTSTTVVTTTSTTDTTLVTTTTTSTTTTTATTPGSCGDGVCFFFFGEACGNCPVDCGPCGTCVIDGACDRTAGESCIECSADCGSCSCAVDGLCDTAGGENCATCGIDCNPCFACGDGFCAAGETCGSCPDDCCP